jgi:polar amino acid transport system substrate-binding protein
MASWKLVLLAMTATIGIISTCNAESTLIIATGEIPPVISENPDRSFLTAVFGALELEMGVKFVFKFQPWTRCELAVENLEAWGAIPYVRTAERSKKFYFSERLFNSGSKFFGHSADKTRYPVSYTELKELKPYRIGGVRGYWYVNTFREAGIELELVATEEQNIRKLVMGRIDLAPLDETAGWYMIADLFPEERENFFTLGKPLLVKDSFLITSKQYPDTQRLLNQFNKALKTIKEKGTFQQLMKKYGVICTP